VYAKEFKAFSQIYYEKAITHWQNEEEDSQYKGVITVNKKNVEIDYAIRDGDHIVHKTVREETPILDEKPAVIMENNEYLIVNKPSSMPVHACGNFKFNTLQSILENEMLYINKPAGDTTGRSFKGAVKTVHRLDRQTSGIVFFAKTEKSSNDFRVLMKDNKIKKSYFARVRGDFSKLPQLKDGETSVTNMIFCVSNIDAFWECAEVADVPFEHRSKAKEAITRFKFKFYDAASGTSVVKCFPQTGRTH
jgi:23S rRNA-/tRNA-specific pseudouridylate synthase